ncbi:Mismatch repair protein msh3 [Tulasnella sp. 418]|nr:Mismatch repair protein msh3 [Tulasnella sp. 418]
MGAADEIAGGRSTFMVEMQETSDIMKQATSRSLLILDELGRGTSTFDGVAIASAVLQHLVDTVKPKLLFITHYPLIATEFGRMFSDVENLHMGFAQTQGKRRIDFLYKLEPGIASGSFGIECARLAGLSDKILDHAYKQSHEMKILVDRRIESGR